MDTEQKRDNIVPDTLTDDLLKNVAGGNADSHSSDGKKSTIISDEDMIWLYESSYDVTPGTSVWNENGHSADLDNITNKRRPK